MTLYHHPSSCAFRDDFKRCWYDRDGKYIISDGDLHYLGLDLFYDLEYIETTPIIDRDRNIE